MTENEERLKSIREHKENGEIVILDSEGASIVKISEILKQPIEGLLYDLNRDYASLASMASGKSLRWVNDMAIVNVLEYVLKENEALRKEVNDLKLEIGEYAKNPFKDMKGNWDTTPIPTASKPSVEKTNQNASKIMPGFNDQLNICL